MNLKAGVERLKFRRHQFPCMQPGPHPVFFALRVLLGNTSSRRDIRASNCTGLLGFCLQVHDFLFGFVLDEGSGLWCHLSFFRCSCMVGCVSVPACPYVSSLSSLPHCLQMMQGCWNPHVFHPESYVRKRVHVKKVFIGLLFNS